MSEITNYIQKNSDININFIKKFAQFLDNNEICIEFEDIKEWIGYKKKCTILDILQNDKYDFQLDTDYKIQKIKKEGICKPINEIYMTIDTVKCICLMAPTETGQEFRRYYIAMEKLFRQYTSTIIQNSLTNPLPEINKYDFHEQQFYDKEVLYLININDEYYKYGITQNIKKRLTTHRNLLKYKYVIKCWDCINRTVSKRVEDDIKRFLKINKLNCEYKGNFEIIKTTQIEKIIDILNQYVTMRTDEYKKLFNDQKYEQKIKLIEKITEMKKIHIEELNKAIEANEKYNHKSNSWDVNDILKLADINEKDLILDHESKINNIKDAENFNKSIQYCKRCKNYKKLEDFGIDETTNEYFKQCKKCHEEGKIVDKRRYEKAKENIIVDEDDYIEIDKIDGNEMQNKYREYYEKNKSEIIEHKKHYRNQRIQNINDSTKNYCRKCNTIKSNEEFGINKKTKEQYKQCAKCREKQKKHH